MTFIFNHVFIVKEFQELTPMKQMKSDIIAIALWNEILTNEMTARKIRLTKSLLFLTIRQHQDKNTHNIHTRSINTPAW